MSIKLDRHTSAFRESQWIVSEDTNVEYLLDVFTSIDPNSDDVWEACRNFIHHLGWHKPRHTILRRKIENLPDGLRKVQCTLELAHLLGSFGNGVERKQLLNHTLELAREWGDDGLVAEILTRLSAANQLLDHFEEGIQQAKEASEIFQQLSNTEGQTECLIYLAWLLLEDGQLDAATEATSQLIDLLPEKGQEFRVCQYHHLLSLIHHSKGEMEKAIHHSQEAIAIASVFNWHGHLFSAHFNLGLVFVDQGEFETAYTHTEQAESHAVNNTYLLGNALYACAAVRYRQHRLEEAKSEALRAAEIYEQLGAVKGLEFSKGLLQTVEQAMESQAAL